MPSSSYSGLGVDRRWRSRSGLLGAHRGRARRGDRRLRRRPTAPRPVLVPRV